MSAAAAPSALVDITEDAPTPDPADDQTTLVSTETATVTTEGASEKKRSKKKSGRKSKTAAPIAAEVEEVEEKNEEGDLDDLEFWLSRGDAPAPKKKQVRVLYTNQLTRGSLEKVSYVLLAIVTPTTLCKPHDMIFTHTLYLMQLTHTHTYRRGWQ